MALPLDPAAAATGIHIMPAKTAGGCRSVSKAEADILDPGPKTLQDGMKSPGSEGPVSRDALKYICWVE